MDSHPSHLQERDKGSRIEREREILHNVTQCDQICDSNEIKDNNSKHTLCLKSHAFSGFKAFLCLSQCCVTTVIQ